MTRIEKRIENLLKDRTKVRYFPKQMGVKDGYSILLVPDNTIVHLLDHVPDGYAPYDNRHIHIDFTNFTFSENINTKEIHRIIALAKKTVENSKKRICTNNGEYTLCGYSNYGWDNIATDKTTIKTNLSVGVKQLSVLPKNTDCDIYIHNDYCSPFYRFDFKGGYSIVIAGIIDL